MELILQAFDEIFSGIPVRAIILGILVFVIGQFLIRVLEIFMEAIVEKFSLQKKNYTFQKLTVYGLQILLILLFLKVIKVDFKYILGAASVLTLAIGFAARTSISNLISGFFLIFEKPFLVDDIVEINDVKGVVLSMNLMAVRVRTLDNLLVRIPNEVVAGASVRNLTHFPIRRFDLKLVFSHKESLTNIHKLLLTVAEGDPMALDEPEPYFCVDGFHENYIEVKFSVWTPTENYFDFMTDFPKAVHRAIKNSGIDQPYQSVLYIDKRLSEERNS